MVEHVYNLQNTGSSLAVQWLGLRAFTAMALSSIPGQGTKIRQAEPCGQKKRKTKKNTQNTENTDSYIGSTVQNLVIDRRIHSKEFVATVLGNVSIEQAY